MTQKFYGYKHWTLESVPRCFYVGKGLRDRPEKRNQRNHKWKAIVVRFGYRVEICVGPISNEEACLWEIAEIHHEGTFFRIHNHDELDIGCNFTHGGDGVSGWQHDVTSKLKMSISHSGVALSKLHCQKR